MPFADTKWGPQIWTSKSQIQLHDGFYVYESSNVKSTIAWLKLRTRIMAELYEVRHSPDHA